MTLERKRADPQRFLVVDVVPNEPCVRSLVAENESQSDPGSKRQAGKYRQRHRRTDRSRQHSHDQRHHQRPQRKAQKDESGQHYLYQRQYQRRRKPQNLAMMAAMEGFKRLFESDRLPLRLLRNDGMALFNGAGPLKKQLIRQAMGLT